MMRVVRVQRGHGRNRPLFVSFHVPASSLKEALQDSDLGHVFALSVQSPAGGYGKPPGWDKLLQEAADGGWPGGPVAFIGYAAGCSGLRELLKAGALPDIMVALDGIHGPRGQVPALPDTLAPWRSFASLARSGESLFVITHTYQTYTESLPEGERFPATVNTVRAVTGWRLIQGGPADSPVQTSEGCLFVLSYASSSKDKEVHQMQLTRALPHVLKKHIASWLGQTEETLDGPVSTIPMEGTVP